MTSPSRSAPELGNSDDRLPDPLADATILWQRQKLPVATIRSADSAPSFGAVTRLMVLVPAFGLDQSGLLNALHALSRSSNTEVVFLGLLQDPDSQASYFLDVVRLASAAREMGMQARAQQVLATEWQPALTRVTAPGDLLVTYQDTSQPGGFYSDGAHGMPFTKLAIPVCLLSNVYTPALPQPTIRLISASIWFVPVVFLFIQWEIIRSIDGTAQTAVLCLSVLVEFAIILALDLARKR